MVTPLRVPAERVANAYRHTEQCLKDAFAEVGLSWPPKQVYLRARAGTLKRGQALRAKNRYLLGIG